MKELTHVMAIGANAYGKATSIEEALNNWYRNAMRSSGPITVHMRAVSEDAYMDGIGTLYAERAEKLPDIILSAQDRETIWGGKGVLQDLIYPVVDQIYELDGCSIDTD